MEQGFSQCELEVTERLLNPNGVVHGGVIYSLADTAMGGALYSTLSGDESCATIEMKVAYFKPITSGTLSCTAEVLHKSRRLGYLESEVKSGDQLVAKATGTFSILNR
jgi:acyl-CoA thioesterase